MPNIAITNYCNLSCPYCFANNFIELQKQNIAEEELNVILNFFLKDLSSIHKIGIIGGEPTLHPNFEQIIKIINNFAKQYKLPPPIIFSNGILLGEYAYLFTFNHALINLNNPDIIGNSKWHDIELSLKKLDACEALSKNITFGINLYDGMPNWDYIFETAKKYRQEKIRCSLVAPTKCITYTNKDEYYENGKILFLHFIEDAKKYNIKIHLDCNHIPKCYFTEQELSLMDGIVDDLQDYCSPTIDITPNLQAISCFGISKPIDINKFENLAALERYFTFEQNLKLSYKNRIGKCEKCSMFEYYACQGGCLAFAK